MTPCPVHGAARLDQAGRCMPSCGHGWEIDPLAVVRGIAEQERAE
jgi:hypothetical protein